VTADDLIRDLHSLIAPGGAHNTTIKGVSRPNSTAPKGWEPGVKYESNRMIVNSLGQEANIQGNPAAWKQAVEALGLEVPHGYCVRLAEAKYDPAAWHRDTEFVEYPDAEFREDGKKQTKAPAVTRPVWRYRFVVEPDSGQMHLDDIDRIVAETLKKRRKIKAAPAGAVRRALNVVYADPQAGKVAILGGTQALAHRLGDSFDMLTDHIRDLKKIGRMPTEATWLDAGDSCEGFNNVAAQKYTNDMTMTQQVRFHRRATLHGLDYLADRFASVQAATCGSNHAQIRDGKDPVGPPDNDWGIEVLSQAQDAYSRNEAAYGHVKFAYPHQWRDTLSLNSGGLPVGLAHGHQWRNPDTKAVQGWWQGQTFGDQPVAHARVLVSGHFHHFAAREMGDGRLWLQAPTLDNGSDWWTQISGDMSAPGLMVFSSTEDGWDDLRILRSTGSSWEPESEE
jgi:hypothetical protein